MTSQRLDRSVRFFGIEGQKKLRAASCAAVGVGGLGTHVVQQAALLRIGGLTLIDGEVLDDTNLNRYVGVGPADVGIPKVDLAERLVHSIDSSIRVNRVYDSFISEAGFAALRAADYVLGCLDSEGARLVLTEFCAAYELPYFDLASDIVLEPDLQYGGRVCAAVGGGGCLCCHDVLDLEEAGRDLESEAARAMREAIYGVDRRLLGRSGPSVVTVNGVVASLAMTELLVTVTDIRAPQPLLTYYGTTGKVMARVGPPAFDCWYCSVLRGSRDDANIERHLRRGR